MYFNIENLVGSDVIQGIPVMLQQVLPEFSLLCLATLVLLIDSFLPRKALIASDGMQQDKNIKNYKITFRLVNLVLLVILMLVWLQSQILGVTVSGAFVSNDIANNLVSNMVVNDSLTSILKTFMILFVLFSFYFSENYLNHHKIFSGEYFAMGLFSLLGMMILVSSQNLLVMYLGLELFSLPIYAMVAMQRNSAEAGEASLKYFVMGAIATGLLLFGISIIYGLSGSFVLSEIANHAYATDVPLILAIIFICVGIAFKFGAAPFHMWMPDVYQGAPTATTLFIATAPKLAAFGMAVRLLNEGFPDQGEHWGYALLMIALLSIAWGNIAAVAQTNFKRLLAYSGISHMGFIILGLVTASMTTGEVAAAGFAAGLFYTITYGLMSLAVFGFILTVGGGKYELIELEDYKGLYYKKPWLALMMLILLFSMAGVPPFVGFFAKLGIIKSLVVTGYTTSAIFAVLFTVIGAFYYLKLVWLMFFEEPSLIVTTKSKQTIGEQRLSLLDNTLIYTVTSNKLIMSLSCLLILALGIYSQWLLVWCMAVFN